jgi:hypothetical protein
LKIVLKLLGGLVLFLILGVSLIAAYINWFEPPGFTIERKIPEPDSGKINLSTGKKIVSNFCASCHLSGDGALSGRILMEHKQWGLIGTGNLTKHPDSNISSYSDAELFIFLRTGIKKDGKMAYPMMPKSATISDQDLYSAIAFLRSE